MHQRMPCLRFNRKLPSDGKAVRIKVAATVSADIPVAKSLFCDVANVSKTSVALIGETVPKLCGMVSPKSLGVLEFLLQGQPTGPVVPVGCDG